MRFWGRVDMVGVERKGREGGNDVVWSELRLIWASVGEEGGKLWFWAHGTGVSFPGCWLASFFVFMTPPSPIWSNFFSRCFRYLLFVPFFLRFYLFIRESVCMHAHGQEEGQRKREKHTPCWAWSPAMWGSIARPWGHDLSRSQTLNWLEPPRRPLCFFNSNRYLCLYSFFFFPGI